MKKIKMAMFDSRPYDIEFFDLVNKKYNYEIKYFKNRLSADTVKLTEGYNAVCVFVNDPLDSFMIGALSKSGIEIIALRCAGYNNVDLKAAYGKLHVVRVPEYSPYAVAEHAAALILSLNRKIHKAYYRTKDSNFNINGFLGFDMHGKTAGVIGTGKIGRVFIGIMLGFGMKVLAYDAYPDGDYAAQNGFAYVPLRELYGRSDIISLHCPLNRETSHLINRESLAEMKTGVMLINTGRGRLIDTRALIKALKDGTVGAAGLDVYEEESEYFFEDRSAEIMSDDVLARLLSFPNVLITSHQGFFTREALYKIADTTFGNLRDFFSGAKLSNEVCYKCDNSPCARDTAGRCF